MSENDLISELSAALRAYDVWARSVRNAFTLAQRESRRLTPDECAQLMSDMPGTAQTKRRAR